MTTEDIRKAIADKGIEVVSFDIFDTLLLRPFFVPTDLFELLDARVTDLLGTIDRIDFKMHRMEAEHVARQRFVREHREDVTLDDIYRVLMEILELSREQSALIKQWELELELRFCRPRCFARELFELAMEFGKRVVIASDMYLSADILDKLLRNNGYTGYEKLYVSSEVGVTKASGNLYKHIVEDLSVSPDHILHIGDNETADVLRARKQGWKSIHLPKCIDLLMNALPDRYSGEVFQRAYGESFLLRYQAPNSFLGLRTMLALIGLKIFDNPFRPIGENSDLNGEPALLGYGVLGPHLFAVADWLHHEMKVGNYDRLCFMARDGYLPMKAYELLRDRHPDAPESVYVYFTRSSVMPLRITKAADWWSLSRGVIPKNNAPMNIVSWFFDFMEPEEKEEFPKRCEENGFPYEQKFASIEEWDAFIRFFKKNYYHPEKFQKYREEMTEALRPQLKGRNATFDIGYHYRVDDALKQMGFDITPYCLHIQDDMASCRAERNDFHGNTFWGYCPGVMGMVREVLISELAPTCKKLTLENGIVQPVYGEKKSQPGEDKIKLMQENALAFVRDMRDTFGEELRYLYYQREDASLALEYFLTHPKAGEVEIFADLRFEEDLVKSMDFRLSEFWKWQIEQMKRSHAESSEEDPRFRFPAEKISKGTRLVIYGGGVVGKTYLSQARSNTDIQVVALCDREPDMTGIHSVQLLTPAQLAGVERESYDMVLIAIERQEVAAIIQRDLEGLGISGQMIHWYNPARQEQ